MIVKLHTINRVLAKFGLLLVVDVWDGQGERGEDDRTRFEIVTVREWKRRVKVGKARARFELAMWRVPYGSPRRRLTSVMSAIGARARGGGYDSLESAIKVANLRDLERLPAGDAEGDAARALREMIEGAP